MKPSVNKPICSFMVNIFVSDISFTVMSCHGFLPLPGQSFGAHDPAPAPGEEIGVPPNITFDDDDTETVDFAGDADAGQGVLHSD